MRLSGLQKEVLSLYRKCLREARKKPAVRVFLFYQSATTATNSLAHRMLSITSEATLGMTKYHLKRLVGLPNESKKFLGANS